MVFLYLTTGTKFILINYIDSRMFSCSPHKWFPRTVTISDSILVRCIDNCKVHAYIVVFCVPFVAAGLHSSVQLPIAWWPIRCYECLADIYIPVMSGALIIVCKVHAYMVDELTTQAMILGDMLHHHN